MASYAPHEREARIKGVPVLGSGRIFPVAEEMFAIEQRDFPRHWPRIIGCDFGWDHPFAAVELIWDRDTDTVYVSRCYRVREATPIVHAAVLRAWGKIPIAWPRDGRRETLEPIVEMLEHFEAATLHRVEHVHQAGLDTDALVLELRVDANHVQALRLVLLG